jgi:hypothetical protein
MFAAGHRAPGGAVVGALWSDEHSPEFRDRGQAQPIPNEDDLDRDLASARAFSFLPSQTRSLIDLQIKTLSHRGNWLVWNVCKDRRMAEVISVRRSAPSQSKHQHDILDSKDPQTRRPEFY